jgi:hypothetical protein
VPGRAAQREKRCHEIPSVIRQALEVTGEPEYDLLDLA